MAKITIKGNSTLSILFRLIAVVTALAVLVPTTSAVCCHSYTPGICADCTQPLGFFDGYALSSCPAVKGDCNAFGCKCVSGCRQPPVGQKACAPTAHLHSPRTAKSNKHCWLVHEREQCIGREFRRSLTNLNYNTSNSK